MTITRVSTDQSLEPEASNLDKHFQRVRIWTSVSQHDLGSTWHCVGRPRFEHIDPLPRDCESPVVHELIPSVIVNDSECLPDSVFIFDEGRPLPAVEVREVGQYRLLLHRNNNIWEYKLGWGWDRLACLSAVSSAKSTLRSSPRKKRSRSKKDREINVVWEDSDMIKSVFFWGKMILENMRFFVAIWVFDRTAVVFFSCGLSLLLLFGTQYFTFSGNNRKKEKKKN